MSFNNTDITNNDPVKDAITEARRTQIHDAAAQVFADKGFHKATIKDVARAAGVADGTIYNYFKSKQDLMVAMVAQFAELSQLVGQISQLAEVASPEQLLKGIFTNRIELVMRNRTQIQAIMPQVLSDPELRTLFYQELMQPTIAKIEAVWQQKRDQGQIRDLDPHIVVQTILGMFIGMTILDLVTNSTLTGHEPEVIDTISSIMLHGIMPADDQTEAVSKES
jgi:AcrR family transcriptional regulator